MMSSPLLSAQLLLLRRQRGRAGGVCLSSSSSSSASSASSSTSSSLLPRVSATTLFSSSPLHRRHHCQHRHQHHYDRYFSSMTPSSSQPTNHQNNIPSTTTSDDHHPLVPINFTTQSQISGSESHILEIQLHPHQILRAESGAMLYMTQGIIMETSMGESSSNSSSSSAFQAGLTRVMTGQNLMISDFRYIPPETTAAGGKEEGSYGTIGLGTDFPAKILKFDLSAYPSSKLICQKGAYIAGSHDITMEMAFVKTFTGGFFGGEGFILQSLQASGDVDEEGIGESSSGSSSSTVFLKAYGTVVKRDLSPGERLRISSGCLVCMTSTVEYDVTTMSGFANVVFGGEGLFVTTLTGPGSVWLQSMPPDRMVSEIARQVPRGGGIGLGIPIMGGGGGDASAGAGAGADADAAAAAVGATDAGENEVVGDGSGDSGVSAMSSDAAIDADRNATIASSAGVPSSSSSDPDSSESLFGDAAFGGEMPSGIESSSSSAPSSSSHEMNEGDTTFSTIDDEYTSSQQPSSVDDTNDVPELDESTISEDELFEDDGTTFSTHVGGGDNATELPTIPDGCEESSSILGQLWELFRDFTDRD